MQFQLVSQTSLPLKPQLLHLWYSNAHACLVARDDHAAFALRPADIPPVPTPLSLPLPSQFTDEIQNGASHGLQPLPLTDSLDYLRTVVFGPDFKFPLLHPASGLVLAFNSGSMELLRRSPTGLIPIDKTRTRGRAALAFAAHPTQNYIVYGDNYGTFHAHFFDATGFKKASKIAAKERNANCVEFSPDGSLLMLGGMGYLAAYSTNNNKFTLLHEISTAVRDFIWRDDLILVNQGIHGVTAYTYSPSGFTKLADLQPDAPIKQIILSQDRRTLAASFQDSGTVSIYSLSP